MSSLVENDYIVLEKIFKGCKFLYGSSPSSSLGKWLYSPFKRLNLLAPPNMLNFVLSLDEIGDYS